MKKFTFFIFFVCSMFLFQNEVFASKKKVVWKWNQTNKVMPQCVKDSISSYFKRYNEDYLFTMWGDGFSTDKKDIDGIYKFRLFASHQPMHFMIIHNNAIYIMECLTVQGIMAEMCRLIDTHKMDNKLSDEVYKFIYKTLLDEYESYDTETGVYNSKFFCNEAEKTNYLWLKSRKEIVIQLSEQMMDNSFINNFPYYIITKNLNEEECILILGIIAKVVAPEE